MAQKEKYPEELMLEAVVRYADNNHGKIKVSELTRWANDNIPGLEGVEEHNFRAKRKSQKGGKNQNNKEYNKAYLKIKDINAARRSTASIKHNRLLNSTNLDDFFEEPKTEQRRQIIETRNRVDVLLHDNNALLTQNRLLQKENKDSIRQLTDLKHMISEIQIKQAEIDKKLTLLFKLLDEEQRTAALAQLGIKDGGFDLIAFTKKLQIQISEVFSFSNAIKPIIEINNEEKPAIESIIGGIEFETYEDLQPHSARME